MAFAGKTRVSLGLGISFAIGSLTSAAHADDASAAFYDDVKSVIQDVMVEEVAHTAVPNAICQAPVLLRYYPSSMQRLFDRQVGALKGGLQEETAMLLGSFVYASITSAGTTADLREFLIAQKPPIVLENGADCPDAILDANGPYYFARNQEAKNPATEDFRPLLDEKCSDGNNTGQSVVPCEVSLALHDYVAGQKDSAEGHLRRLLAYLIGSVSAPALTSDAQLEQLSFVFEAYFKDPELATIPTVDDAALKAALVAGSTLLKDIQTIAREWQLLTRKGTERLSPRLVIDVMLAAAMPSLRSACNNLNECKKMLQVVRSQGVRDLIAAANRGDARGVAVEALRAAFSIVSPDSDCSSSPEQPWAPEKKQVYLQQAAAPAKPIKPTCEQQTTISSYGRFAATLASYVMESDGNQAASEATRAAFRSAAFDLLRSDGPSSGFDRSFAWSIVLPNPALRVSWSPGYVNEATSDGFRYVATLDWLTFRARFRYTQGSYIQGSISLVDLLGPFSEAALRQQSPAPSEAGRMWNNFFNPRAELAMGFPSLSTHLALVASISYRSAAAFRDPGSDDYAYYTWLRKDRPSDFESKPKGFYSQFIESSIGLKYIP